MRSAGFAPRTPADDGTTDGLQRLLVGGLTARWTYTTPDVTFRPFRQGVRAAIIDTFAWHASRSVQHTLYGIADVILATYQEISEVALTLQERPYRSADLFRTMVDHPRDLDDLFVAAEEPLGIVEVVVERNA
jgi:urate oxidase